MLSRRVGSPRNVFHLQDTEDRYLTQIVFLRAVTPPLQSNALHDLDLFLGLHSLFLIESRCDTQNETDPAHLPAPAGHPGRVPAHGAPGDPHRGWRNS